MALSESRLIPQNLNAPAYAEPVWTSAGRAFIIDVDRSRSRMTLSPDRRPP
jgi:hypothetical protein